MRLRALLALLLLAPVAAAQPVLDRLTRADGLPSDYVFAIHQDRQGFLWFGTDAGLARYDGQRVETFTTDDGLPHSLIYSLAEDAQGTLYAGTYRGLARFDGRRFAYVPTPAGAAGVGTLAVDGQGRFVVTGNPRGVEVRDGARWRALPVPGLHADQSVLTLPDGRMLVNQLNGGLSLLQTDPLRLEAVPGIGTGARPVRGPDGTVYVYQPGFVIRLRVEGGRAVRLDSMATDADPRGGLRYLFAQGRDVYVSLERAAQGSGVYHLRWGQRGPAERLLPTWATTMATDYEGQLWMGTFGTGVVRVRARHLHSFSDRPAVRLARAPDGSVWASGDGLYRVAPGAETAERYAPASEVRALVVTAGGEVVASESVSAHRLRTPIRGGSIGASPRVATHPSWIAGLDVQGDTVRAATYGGGVRTFVAGRLVRTQDQARGLPTDVVEDLVRTRSGLWMLTRTHGVLREQGARVQALGRAAGLPSSAVFSVFEDAAGTVWIGTDRGVARLRRGATRADALGTALLKGQRVTGWFVRPSEPGCVYAVGERSLYRIAGDRVDAVSAFALLPDARAAINAALYDAASDRLFLATTRGLVAARLGGLPTVPLPPPRLAVRQIVVDDQAVPLAVDSAGDVTVPLLPPGRHRVEVAFAPLAFVGDVRAEVRVGPGQWRSVGSDRRVVLPELGPGTTQLSLRAVRLDGGAASAPLAVAITVRPFLWQRPWAWALGVLALVALSGAGVWVLGRRRLRAQVRALEAEQRVQRVRERLSRDLHDHIGGHLATLVSAADLAGLAAARGDTARALGVAADLADEARQALGQLRQTVRALQHDALSAADLFRQVRAQAEGQLRYADRPVLDARLEGTAPDAVYVDAEVGLQVLRVAQEAVTNVLRHARAQSLRLTLRAEAAALELVVEDDGVGLDAAPEGDAAPGFGLPNMRARAAEVGGMLAVARAAQGTRVSLSVPVLETGRQNG